MTSVTVKNLAAITDPAEVGGLLRAIEGYTGQPVTGFALRLAPLLFVRPGELRRMEWSEVDLDGAVWKIPGPKMKMRIEHIVPLSVQAVALLRELQLHTGDGKYAFPGARSAARPMSENTVNGALRRLGYGGQEHTGHGFRSTASTILNELGWNPDAIEAQLAHQDGNQIRPGLQPRQVHAGTDQDDASVGGSPRRVALRQVQRRADPVEGGGMNATMVRVLVRPTFGMEYLPAYHIAGEDDSGLATTEGIVRSYLTAAPTSDTRRNLQNHIDKLLQRSSTARRRCAPSFVTTRHQSRTSMYAIRPW